LLDGLELGLELGLLDGLELGLPDGLELGLELGLPDGLELGLPDGLELGLELGEWELSTQVPTAFHALVQTPALRAGAYAAWLHHPGTLHLKAWFPTSTSSPSTYPAEALNGLVSMSWYFLFM
jgi:hypothetical protein